MAYKKNVLLFVPDGVGIRNYLYSRVFKNRTAKLHLYHNFDDDTIGAIEAQINLESTLEIP